MNRVLDIVFVLLAVFSIGVVYTSSHIDESLLATLTKEMGLYENISVIILLCIGIYGTVFFIKRKASLDKLALFFIPAFSLLAFVAALEEVSWGQHIFGFESGEFFEENNLQKETNIHNLIDGNIFSSVIYFSTYAFFVFLPAFNTFFPKFLSFLPSNIIPSLRVSLIILFGSTFQLYFYDDFGVFSDMVTLMAGFVLLGIVLIMRFQKVSALFYLLGVISMIFCMMSYEIFDFYNMQYEIREMFVMLGALYWFIEVTEKRAKRLF
ncbi:MAG: hypothetical protein ACLFOC_05545 [Campylobacterales bacterium]